MVEKRGKSGLNSHVVLNILESSITFWKSRYEGGLWVDKTVLHNVQCKRTLPVIVYYSRVHEMKYNIGSRQLSDVQLSYNLCFCKL